MYCQVVALLKATILSAPNADIKIACVIVYVLETRTSTGDRHVESTILTHQRRELVFTLHIIHT